jgi:hypothetical protein
MAVRVGAGTGAEQAASVPAPAPSEPEGRLDQPTRHLLRAPVQLSPTFLTSPARATPGRPVADPGEGSPGSGGSCRSSSARPSWPWWHRRWAGVPSVRRRSRVSHNPAMERRGSCRSHLDRRDGRGVQFRRRPAARRGAAHLRHVGRRGHGPRIRTSLWTFAALAGVSTLVVFVLTLSELTARPLPEALSAAGVLRLGTFGPGLPLLATAMPSGRPRFRER